MGCAQKAAEFIKSGRLGQVTLVEGKIHRNTRHRRLVLPDPAGRLAATVDFKRFLGSAPPRDFDLRRFFQWRLFWDYSGGLPTDLFVHLITATHQLMGVQEPESVFSLRRHLPLEELPRGAGPDDVDGEVPRRLRAAPHQHRRATATRGRSSRSTAARARSSTTATRSSSSTSPDRRTSATRRTRGRRRQRRQFKELMNLNDKLSAARRRRRRRRRSSTSRRTTRTRRARTCGTGSTRSAPAASHRGRAVRPPRGARRPHVQPLLQGRQAREVEQDDAEGRGVKGCGTA